MSSCRLARAAASKAAPNSSSTTTQFAEMVLSEDADQDNVEEKFRGLCADLNIDRNTADEAWRNYETISTNYTLEVTEQAP